MQFSVSLNHGDFFNEIGEYNKALLDYNKAIELDPDDMDYLFYRSLNYADLEENEKAISDLLRIIELDKDGSYIKENGRVYNALAVFYGALENYDKQLEYYNEEINLNPDDYLAYRNRANLYRIWQIYLFVSNTCFREWCEITLTFDYIGTNFSVF